MELYKKIEDDVKSALKEGNAVKVSVLRMLISAVKMIEIDKKINRAQDSDVVNILKRQIKQHKDSIEQFEKGKRSDLADKEAGELKILESYMPEQLSDNDIDKLVREAISATGATAKSDVGKVMKAVMEKAGGRTDGKTVNQAALKLLK